MLGPRALARVSVAGMKAPAPGGHGTALTHRVGLRRAGHTWPGRAGSREGSASVSGCPAVAPDPVPVTDRQDRMEAAAAQSSPWPLRGRGGTPRPLMTAHPGSEQGAPEPDRGVCTPRANGKLRAEDRASRRPGARCGHRRLGNRPWAPMPGSARRGPLEPGRTGTCSGREAVEWLCPRRGQHREPDRAVCMQVCMRVSLSGTVACPSPTHTWGSGLGPGVGQALGTLSCPVGTWGRDWPWMWPRGSVGTSLPLRAQEWPLPRPAPLCHPWVKQLLWHSAQTRPFASQTVPGLSQITLWGQTAHHVRTVLSARVMGFEVCTATKPPHSDGAPPVT